MNRLQQWITSLLTEHNHQWTGIDLSAVEAECRRTRAVTQEEVEQIISDQYREKRRYG